MKLPNHKHEKFVKELIDNGGDKNLAYKKAYKHGVINASTQEGSFRLMNRPEVKERIYELLQTNPKTQIHRIVDGLGDDLNARKEVIVDSNIVSIKDNVMRSSAQDKLLKLYGLIGKDPAEVQIDNRSVNFNINAENIDKLSQICSVFEDMNKRLDIDDGSQSGEIIDVESATE